MVNLESLVALILKSIYFENGDIQNAELWSNPSYIWRSLLWGRELFTKGNNTELVMVPLFVFRRTRGCLAQVLLSLFLLILVMLIHGLTLCSLMGHGFVEEDCDVIRGIPFCLKMKDLLFGNFDKKRRLHCKDWISTLHKLKRF